MKSIHFHPVLMAAVMTLVFCPPAWCGELPAADGPVVWQTLEIPQPPDVPIVLRQNGMVLKGLFGNPVFTPLPLENLSWAFLQRTEYNQVLAGESGKVTEDRYQAGSLTLVRQVWVSPNRDCLALRQKVVNQGTEPIQIQALIPWQSSGEDSFQLGTEGAHSWEMVVQYWQKNGIPISVRPAASTRLEHDQFALFRSRSQENAPTLRIGYLDTHSQNANLITEFEEKQGKTALKAFTARCELDGCRLPTRGERTTPWLFFTAGLNAGELMFDYADRVGRHYSLPAPGPAPTVWCSWYYYAEKFTEKDLADNLGYLAAYPMPFDVILIDECWAKYRGDWFANEQWSSGMKAAARQIRQTGYQPGLWTCPYIADPDSQLVKERPEWLLKHTDGSPHFYNKKFPVLDPTYPGVCDHLEEIYRRLTFDDGFTYHKLDFMRAVIQCKEEKPIRFYNPAVTRVEAYRQGLEAIRRGTGPDAYISVCGGHYGASIGIADGQRSGSDIESVWDPNRIENANQVYLRTWMNRLWQTDADAMMVRLRAEAEPGVSRLSIGRLTDEEARTISLHQYLTGGISCLSENLNDLQDSRRRLYRHVIPSINTPAVCLNPFEPIAPSLMLSRITPLCPDLPNWITISVVNWTDADKEMTVELTEAVLSSLVSKQVLVFDFFTQETLGLYQTGDAIPLGALKPHSAKLLRIAPWDGKTAVLAGTDLHYSGGGAEIAQWQADFDQASGRLETDWLYPVTITVAFPAGESFELRTAVLNAGRKLFTVYR